MKHILEYILVGIVAVFLFGCSADENFEPVSEKVKLEIVPVLSSMAASRAVTDTEDSYWAFENGDQCGFFSEHKTGNDTGGYDNLIMTFNGGLFSCNEMVDINQMGHTFVYFPYNQEISQGIDVRNPDGSVMDLLAGVDGYYELLKGYRVTFLHAFSMLIIKGGKGFEHLAEQEITVTIDRPIEKIKLVDNPGSGSLKIFEFSGEGSEYTQFKGVKKGKYKDSKTGKEVDAWFIIIPSAGKPVKVKSITAYDDLGRKQVVPVPDSDISDGKGLQIATRYPLTLKMDELVPTISVDAITPWNTETMDIQTTTGINSVFPPGEGSGDSSFQTWASTYVAYVENTRSAVYEETLKKFGSKDEQGIWHFTINVDLDFARYKADDDELLGQVISVLEDELDCAGHTLSNLSLSNDVAAGFIGEIRRNGKLSNLRMENISVKGGNSASGLVAAKISGGRIEDCFVENMQVECNNAVGALAGEMTGGEAVNCHFIGRIIGTRTASGELSRIVGTYTQGTLTDVNVTNVAFGKIN